MIHIVSRIVLNKNSERRRGVSFLDNVYRTRTSSVNPILHNLVLEYNTEFITLY